MKRIATIALMVNLAIASVYAQQSPVKMTFSGTGAASPIDLKQRRTQIPPKRISPGTVRWASLPFEMSGLPQLLRKPSSTCAGLYFPSVAGAGVFRFQDGSLLKVTLTQGGDCIDLVQMVGHCTLTFKITGGTGRFKNASGVLTYTETAMPLLGDGSNNPVFFAETGEFTGTISGVGGVATEEESQDVRQ